MTLDLSKAKVGDKVKHRNGGVSVINRITENGIVCDGLFFAKSDGRYYGGNICVWDVVELIQADDELEKAIIGILSREGPGSFRDLLIEYAKAIKESR